MNAHVNAVALATSSINRTMTKQRITLSEREDKLIAKLAKLMKLSKAQLLKRACGSIGLQPHVNEGTSPVISLEGLTMHEWEEAVKTFENHGNVKEDFLTFTLLDYVNDKL